MSLALPVNRKYLTVLEFLESKPSKGLGENYEIAFFSQEEFETCKGNKISNLKA